MKQGVHTLSGQHTEPYRVKDALNNVLIEMELITEAAVSVFSGTTYKDIRHQSFASLL